MYTNIIIDEAEQFNNEFNQAKSKLNMGSNMLSGGQSNQSRRQGGNNRQQDIDKYALPDNRYQKNTIRK